MGTGEDDDGTKRVRNKMEDGKRGEGDLIATRRRREGIKKGGFSMETDKKAREAIGRTMEEQSKCGKGNVSMLVHG